MVRILSYHFLELEKLTGLEVTSNCSAIEYMYNSDNESGVGGLYGSGHVNCQRVKIA